MRRLEKIHSRRICMRNLMAFGGMGGSIPKRLVKLPLIDLPAPSIVGQSPNLFFFLFFVCVCVLLNLNCCQFRYCAYMLHERVACNTLPFASLLDLVKAIIRKFEPIYLSGPPRSLSGRTSSVEDQYQKEFYRSILPLTVRF